MLKNKKHTKMLQFSEKNDFFALSDKTRMGRYAVLPSNLKVRRYFRFTLNKKCTFQ